MSKDNAVYAAILKWPASYAIADELYIGSATGKQTGLRQRVQSHVTGKTGPVSKCLISIGEVEWFMVWQDRGSFLEVDTILRTNSQFLSRFMEEVSARRLGACVYDTTSCIFRQGARLKPTNKLFPLEEGGHSSATMAARHRRE